MVSFDIVICCYNGEKYIKSCIESIQNQIYKNYNIIFIDDGSIDDTEKVLYNMNIKNLKYIKQKHKGISSARNTGISNLMSEYFIFVDVDDTIEEELLFKLNNFIKKYNSEIVRYNAIQFPIIDEKKYIASDIINLKGTEFIKKMHDDNIKFGPLWLYCYKTKFIKDNSISFLENCIHEDFLNNYIISIALKVSNINYIGYNYFKNIGSITTLANRDYDMKRLNDLIKIYDYVLSLIEKKHFNDRKFICLMKKICIGFLIYNTKYFEGILKCKYEAEIDKRKYNDIEIFRN